MMQPNFDDVLEYVKAGEDNPEMGEMLKNNPYGQELLKQARFICKMLQHQSESEDDGDVAADFGDVAAMFSRVAESPSMDAMREIPERTFYQAEISPSLPRKKLSIENLIESEGRRSDDLGMLEYAIEGEQVVLSYMPSATAIKLVAALAASESIQIPARRYTLSLPHTQAADEPVVIRVAHRLKNIPAKSLNLIFMPESGPFVRLRTDSNGLLPMRLSDQPGTLRIEAPMPQLLRIQPKN